MKEYSKEKESVLAQNSEPYSDRFNQYLIRQQTQSPRSFFKEVRRYWLLALLLNLVGLYFMLSAITTSLQKNADVSLNIVRVDGVRVHEAQDVRRDVLMDNALKRNALQQEGK